MKPSHSIQETHDVAQVARRARRASRLLATLSATRRDEVLIAAAAALEQRRDEILAANDLDCDAATVEVEAGRMSRAMFDRLKTSARGVGAMAEQVRGVARLPNPLNRMLTATKLDDDLILHKVSCPLGVVCVIFESRPDVVPQVVSLALKSGNAIILKGGTEAVHTNAALVQVWHELFQSFGDIPVDAVSLLHTREEVGQILALERDIDLVIPRGSQAFVRYIGEHSRIPVLGHGEGVCHVYVDSAADLDKAAAIVLDSKVQYPAACNAAETLLVHGDVAENFLPASVGRLRAAGVEVRGCSRTISLAGTNDIVPATDDDWAAEYSDLIISIKVVDDTEEALAHIDAYGSRHTETIVTEDAATARHFMTSVDAAGVFHNASTRFADGYRYGLGAELGISTGKLHARGPVGLEGLTTYKYKLFGNGQVVSTYASGERAFKHQPLSQSTTDKSKEEK